MPFTKSRGKKPLIDEIPKPDNIEEILNVEYQAFDGLLLHLDIFKPTNIKHKTPVAIVIHGGGFAFGDQTMELPFSRILASKGVLVYAIDYRHVKKDLVFESIKDVICGFEYIYRRLDQDNGDSEKIYVVAESAGTYLSLYAQAFCTNNIFKKWVDYKPTCINIKGNIFVSGMFYANNSDIVGLLYKKKLFGQYRKDKELMRLMNPECKEVLTTLSKSVFITSKHDFLKEYTLQYQKVFNTTNPNNLLLVFDGDKNLDHAFATLKPNLLESKQAMEQTINYFKEKNISF